MPYTNEEKEALLRFVTSVDEPIYAVKDIPPEMFGALASYFSRNPRDFREHILDFIKGRFTEGGQNLKNFLQSNYKSSSEILNVGLEKSRDFFTLWYGKYGHKSIANVVWQGFVGINQSQLVARQLASDQLAFFIEMSTRYVDFNSNSWFCDPDIMNSEFALLYRETIEMLMKVYNYFVEHGKEYYKTKYPFDIWKQKQTEAEQQKNLIFLQRKYEREIDAKAFDLARYLLPQAMPTNFAWMLDGRSIEFDIAAWKCHPLAEIRHAAELIERAGAEVIPSLLKYTKNNPYYGDKLHRYNGNFQVSDYNTKQGKKQLRILYHHPDALDIILAHVIENNNSIPFEEARKIIEQKTLQEKIAMLRILVEKRERHDEWVDSGFQMVNIGIEWTTDVGAVRDLRRHQKNERCEHIYTLDMGYAIPDDIIAMDREAEKIFRDAMEKTHEAEKRIRARFPFQVQYIIPMACLTTLRMNIGLEQVQYLVYTRSTPDGHPSYRQDAFNLCEEVAKIYPWILGYEKYPVGKHIFDVYKEAPIKNIMRLRIDTDEMHQ